MDGVGDIVGVKRPTDDRTFYIAKNKKKKNYYETHLLFGRPFSPCISLNSGPVKIKLQISKMFTKRHYEQQNMYIVFGDEGFNRMLQIQ